MSPPNVAPTATTHLEAEMEVLYIDIFVGGGLALAPQQQALFGCHLLHRNVLDGESQDDGPDHAEGHLQVAVDDFFGADRHQLDALPFDELEGFVDVGDLREEKLGEECSGMNEVEPTLWKRILPRSGFGRVSPEMTSSKSMSLSPLRKSSSILSMAVPALRK